jgi:hypothetical protein
MTLSITALNTSMPSVIMLNVANMHIMLSVNVLSAVMLSVIMLNVVMLNVVVPIFGTLVVNKKFPDIKFSFLFHFVGFHF